MNLIETLAERLWQAESLRATDKPRRIPWSEVGEKEKEHWRVYARVSVSTLAEYLGTL